jgi:hypothetical protein
VTIAVSPFGPLAYDAARARTVLFRDSDTWEFDAANWTRLTVDRRRGLGEVAREPGDAGRHRAADRRARMVSHGGNLGRGLAQVVREIAAVLCHRGGGRANIAVVATRCAEWRRREPVGTVMFRVVQAEWHRRPHQCDHAHQQRRHELQ